MAASASRARVAEQPEERARAHQAAAAAAISSLVGPRVPQASRPPSLARTDHAKQSGGGSGGGGRSSAVEGEQLAGENKRGME